MKYRLNIGLLMLSSSPLIAAPANPIGTVLFTANNVIVEQNHKQHPVTRGALLYSGDTIITAAIGQAIIKYNNGSLVTIQHDSNYVTSPADAQKNSELNATVNHGTIEYSSTGMKKRQGTLHTPVVSLAILGTQFTLSYSPSTKITNVSVNSGVVSMGDQIITAGQTGTASSEGIITTYSPLSSGSVNQGEATTSTFAATNATFSASQTANISTSTNMSVNTGVSTQTHFVMPK